MEYLRGEIHKHNRCQNKQCGKLQEFSDWRVVVGEMSYKVQEQRQEGGRIRTAL